VHDVAGPAVAASDMVLGSADGALPVRAEAYTHDGLSGMLEAIEQRRQFGGAALLPAQQARRALWRRRLITPNKFIWCQHLWV